MNIISTTNYSGLTRSGVAFFLNHIMGGELNAAALVELSALRSTLVAEGKSDMISRVDNDRAVVLRFLPRVESMASTSAFGEY